MLIVMETCVLGSLRSLECSSLPTRPSLIRSFHRRGHGFKSMYEISDLYPKGRYVPSLYREPSHVEDPTTGGMQNTGRISSCLS